MQCSTFSLVLVASSLLAGLVGCSGEDKDCGNGIVAGEEQCDDGNQLDGDCCGSDCQLAPAGTACDDRLCFNGTTTGSCDESGNCDVAHQASAAGRCTVFITSKEYDGALGGLAGADDVCRQTAQEEGLTGTFKAWLSDSTSSAEQRLTHSEVPYVDVWGRRIADNWTDLTDGTLQQAILTDERGFDNTDSSACDVVASVLSGPGMAWTGTQMDGSASTGPNCSDWTDNQTEEQGGEGGLVGLYCLEIQEWTEPTIALTSGCAEVRTLYCFQQ